MLCSVIKHSWKEVMRAWKKCRVKHKLWAAVSPYFLSVRALPCVLYDRGKHDQGFFYLFHGKVLLTFVKKIILRLHEPEQNGDSTVLFCKILFKARLNSFNKNTHQLRSSKYIYSKAILFYRNCEILLLACEKKGDL